MKVIRLVVFAVALAGIASAASSHKITLSSAAKVGAAELKPGDYKVTLDGDKIVIASGKTVVAESAVTVESGAKKYPDTRVSTSNSDIQAISFGGTTTKVTLKK